jgi:hypothetical protein
MCIIVHKPKGKTLDVGTLKRCWDRNPHGAGFMFTQNGAVYGNKGYMTFKDLTKGLAGAGFLRDGFLTKSHAVTIHFRLASHGSIKPTNCHPFPITNDLDIIKAEYWEADIGIAHNGIIPIEVIPGLDISDTMTYILTVLSSELYYDRFKERKIHRQICRDIDWSRLFILKADGSHILFGVWTEEAGILYSNEGFRAPKKRPKAPTVSISYQRELLDDLDWKGTEDTKWIGSKRGPAPPGMKWVR